MSIGRVLDTLETKMEEISGNPNLILNNEYMMNIFREYLDELPEVKEYWDMTFNKKQMSVISRKAGSKVVHSA